MDNSVSRKTSKTPFFSVVVPTYNRAKKIRKALMSVLDQTFEDFELLIMDDGSCDNTAAVVASLNDKRINYHWGPHSGGPATPRNRGIDAARGKWICFLDSDDLWYPKKLETIYQMIIRDSTIDVICNDEYQRNVDDNKCTYIHAGPNCSDIYKKMLLNGNLTSPSATTVRKKTVEKLQIRFNQSQEYFAVEDYDFALHLARRGCRFQFIAIPLGEYSIHNSNISAEPERNRHNLGVLLHDHVFTFQNFDPNYEHLWRRVSQRLHAYDIRVMLGRKKHIKACVKVVRTFIKNPLEFSRYIVSFILRHFQKTTMLNP